MRRFIARRGFPSQIVSDNATNFVGAKRDLNELEKVVKAGAQSYYSIERLFVPPRSAIFGGLWEAAVKSMKHHLRRVMGNSILTYEENTNFILSPLNSNFAEILMTFADICYLYYSLALAIHIIVNYISTSANHIFNEADTSWPAGCWRMTSQ